MTGICFRDPLWLFAYPLDRNLIFDYFALSPFYDYTCNNEHLRLRSIHPLDASHLSQMVGNEYVLSEVTEPHLFVIKKQKRDGPKKVRPMLMYYVLDGSIYQAPQLDNVFTSRIRLRVAPLGATATAAEAMATPSGDYTAVGVRVRVKAKAAAVRGVDLSCGRSILRRGDEGRVGVEMYEAAVVEAAATRGDGDLWGGFAGTDCRA